MKVNGELFLASITVTTRYCLGVDLLNFIGKIDEDINGNNGDEYAWDIAKENGYSSSLAWLEYELFEQCADELDMLQRFMTIMEVHGGYQTDYEIVTNDENKITSVAIALITNY